MTNEEMETMLLALRDTVERHEETIQNWTEAESEDESESEDEDEDEDEDEEDDEAVSLDAARKKKIRAAIRELRDEIDSFDPDDLKRNADNLDVSCARDNANEAESAAQSAASELDDVESNLEDVKSSVEELIETVEAIDTMFKNLCKLVEPLLAEDEEEDEEDAA